MFLRSSTVADRGNMVNYRSLGIEEAEREGEKKRKERELGNTSGLSQYLQCGQLWKI